MLNIQRRIPVLDQIAFLVLPCDLSTLGGVRQNVSSAQAHGLWQPFMERNASLKIAGLAEIKRQIPTVLHQLGKDVVARGWLNAGSGRADEIPIPVGHAGPADEVDGEFHDFDPSSGKVKTNAGDARPASPTTRDCSLIVPSRRTCQVHNSPCRGERESCLQNSQAAPVAQSAAMRAAQASAEIAGFCRALAASAAGPPLASPAVRSR